MTAIQQQAWLKSLKKNVKIFTQMPSGWSYNHGSSAPRGYAWINNNKSVFSKDYEHALLKTA